MKTYTEYEDIINDDTFISRLHNEDWLQEILHYLGVVYNIDMFRELSVCSKDKLDDETILSDESQGTTKLEYQLRNDDNNKNSSDEHISNYYPSEKLDDEKYYSEDSQKTTKLEYRLRNNETTNNSINENISKYDTNTDFSIEKKDELVMNSSDCEIHQDTDVIKVPKSAVEHSKLKDMHNPNKSIDESVVNSKSTPVCFELHREEEQIGKNDDSIQDLFSQESSTLKYTFENMEFYTQLDNKKNQPTLNLNLNHLLIIL